MSDSVRRHGLESLLAAVPRGDAGAGATLTVRGDLGAINLRGNPADERFVGAVATVMGQALPLDAITFAADAHRTYWLGPDEWLVVTGADAAAGLVASLESALAGQAVAINDVSGGHVVLRLAGPPAIDVLARGCTLDLDAAVFPTGSAAQTGLAKAGVLIGRIGDTPEFELVVRRSFADYLVRWVAHAGRFHGVALQG